MKKLKLIAILAVIALLVCVVFTGCGSKNDTAKTDTAAANEPAEEKAEEEPAAEEPAAEEPAAEEPAAEEPAEEEAAEEEPAEEEPAEEEAAAGNHSFVFEAEHTDLTKIQGAGKSNALEGTAVITYDKFDAGASNDYFVGYLYIKNNVVTFNIHSDKDVSGVKFSLRATTESGITSIDSNDLKISVNGTDIAYRTLAFNDVKAGFFSMDSDGLRAFSDYSISSGIDLHEGDNEITFTVVSDSAVDGTATAKAPILDCITLTTPDDSDAELTMEPNAASLTRIQQLEDE